LLQTVELVNRRINPSLKVKGILLCMFDSRTSLSGEVKADIERFLENAHGSNNAWAEARILPTFIRRNIKLAEAPSYGKTIFEYEQNCHGAEDYKKVAEYLRDADSASRIYGSVERLTDAADQDNMEAVRNKPPIKIVEIPRADSQSPPKSDSTHSYPVEGDDENF
jgi:hypothetical protein